MCVRTGIHSDASSGRPWLIPMRRLPAAYHSDSPTHEHQRVPTEWGCTAWTRMPLAHVTVPLLCQPLTTSLLLSAGSSAFPGNTFTSTQSAHSSSSSSHAHTSHTRRGETTTMQQIIHCLSRCVRLTEVAAEHKQQQTTCTHRLMSVRMSCQSATYSRHLHVSLGVHVVVI
jgi:hypothetical protein